MSGEMNPEVVGCDASIMKNVWEIRVREYQQKMLQEQDRLEKSALPSINKDWADRMTAKTGGRKRVERKVEPADSQMDNIWKSKQPLIPPQSKGPLGRPGVQTRSSPGSNLRDKRRQDKTLTRLQYLMFITQTQPSSLVWGKSWRYNKSLPSPAEGSTDWGQNWMFATHQPPNEEGKPCPNESNQVDPLSLHLWRKPDYGMVDCLELDSGLPSEEWKTSWKTSNKIQKDEPVNGKNSLKLGFFTSLVQNEAQCSEWIGSWQSTKPANQKEGCADREGSNANAQSTLRETSSSWEECWRLVNHHGNTKSKSSPSPVWDDSWRAAVYHTSNPSQNQEDQRQQDESHFHKTIHPSTHNRGSRLQLCSEDLTEWNNSWQIPKNNSVPSQELDQVLKAPPPVEPQMEQKNPTLYEQLRHDVMFSTKTQSVQAKPLFKQLENVLPSEWRDSWRMIKHRMRPERKGYRPEALQPVRESGTDVMFTASEWKDSWKFTSQPLNQKPEQWQSWSTSAEIRVKWERHQNVSVMGFPRNGPTTERIWGESWRFSKHQSDPGQSKEHPDDSWDGEKLAGSISDWQHAWMVSETPLRYDKPSLAQWREAWKWSTYHTLNRTDQVPVDRWVDEPVKVLQRSLERAGTKCSSFYDQFVKQRYPETDWTSSWIAGSVNFFPSCYGSSGITEQTESSFDQQQRATAGEFGPQWGQSFRLSSTRPDPEQTWLDTNPRLYSVLWSRGNKTQNDIKSNLNKTSAVVSCWMNSHQFLQNANAQREDKRKSKQPNDPRVILAGRIRTKKGFYSSLEKEKLPDRKWAGSHLLGKTQPRPKRGRGSVNKPKPEDKTQEKFFEEWMESWRFLVWSECLKKPFTFKVLSGWNESWKFLLPSS